MKKSKETVIFFILIGLTILFVGYIHILICQQRKEDSNLLHADVSQAERVVIMTDFVPKSGRSEWTELAEEDIAELVSLLHQVELKGKPTPNFRYDGGTYKMFQIVLGDGREYIFSASNPFYIIDVDRAYKSDYDTCEAISDKYYELLEKYYQEDCPWLK